VKSVVQRGIGDDARLVMVVHECLESRFAAAVEEIGRLDELRARRAHPRDRGGVRLTPPMPP
jgi:homoserine dehydrogenase